MDSVLQRIFNLNQKLNNFGYGLVVNGRRMRNTTASDWDKYLRLQTPQEFITRQVGVCWDYVTFEATIFPKEFPGIPFKSWYIVFDNHDDMPTHTFLTFTYGGRYYWFESSFKAYRGIWIANSETDIINAVMTYMDKYGGVKSPGYSLLKHPYYVFNYDAANPRLYHATCEQFMRMAEEDQIPHKYNPNFQIQKLTYIKEMTGMTVDELRLSIYESMLRNEISQDTAYGMIEVMQEGMFGNPLKKKLEKLKEIKKAKPKDYDGPEAVKKFIDKYYDDIVKCAALVEKEPKELRANEVKATIGLIASMVGMLASGALGAAIESEALLLAGPIIWVLAIIFTSIYTIIQYCRVSNDEQAANDLSKVRTSLKKIDKNKLSKEYQNKVSDIVTAIDDAETEISSRVKVQKESVDMKLKIYEACMTGDITDVQRDELLAKLG